MSVRKRTTSQFCNQIHEIAAESVSPPSLTTAALEVDKADPVLVREIEMLKQKLASRSAQMIRREYNDYAFYEEEKNEI